MRVPRRPRAAVLLALLISPPSFGDEWILIKHEGRWCRRLSSTYLMRDPAFCGGQNRFFCITPLECRLPGPFSNQQLKTYGVAGCRAHVNTLGPEGCPGLQDCADAPETEFEHVNNMWKWKEPCGFCGVGSEKESKGKDDGTGPSRSHAGEVKG